MFSFRHTAGGFEVVHQPLIVHTGVVGMDGQPAHVHEIGVPDAVVAGDQWPHLQTPMIYYLAANDIDMDRARYEETLKLKGKMPCPA